MRASVARRATRSERAPQRERERVQGSSRGEAPRIKMEAPGVAPGSENTSPQASTCVAVSDVSHPTSRIGENRRAPAPEISRHASGTTARRQPAEMTSVPHPQADEDGRSQVFTLRERAAYPQLGWFPSDLRG